MGNADLRLASLALVCLISACACSSDEESQPANTVEGVEPSEAAGTCLLGSGLACPTDLFEHVEYDYGQSDETTPASPAAAVDAWWEPNEEGQARDRADYTEFAGSDGLVFRYSAHGSENVILLLRVFETQDSKWHVGQAEICAGA